MLSLLPTAEEVRIASRLTPAQVNTNYPDTTALEVDIADRIAEKAAEVTGELARAAAPFAWPFTTSQILAAYTGYTSEQATAEIALQNELIKQVVELLALASLYGSAGQMNGRYWEQADRYRAEAKEKLTKLMTSILFVTAQNSETDTNSGAHIITINVADAEVVCDEYGGCG